jgi:DNA-binding beta-propeller fold protein YncE
VVTTLAGFYGSLGAVDGVGRRALRESELVLLSDANGNVYVVDRNNHTIRKVDRGGQCHDVRGPGEHPGGTDGTGSAARFSNPLGIAVDSAGTVYVAEGR